MKKTTRYIFQMLTAEVLCAAAVALFFRNAIAGSTANLWQAVGWLCFPVLAGVLAMFLLGWYIGNNHLHQPKVWHGILLNFALLFMGVTVGTFAAHLGNNIDSLTLNGMLTVWLVFLLFGGIPTLLIGWWFGMRMQQNNQ